MKITEAVGITRALDKLGRVVVPAELRRTHGINTGDLVAFHTGGNGQIVIKKHQEGCIFCGHKQAANIFLVGRGVMVCKTCAKSAAQQAEKVLGE